MTGELPEGTISTAKSDAESKAGAATEEAQGLTRAVPNLVLHRRCAMRLMRVSLAPAVRSPSHLPRPSNKALPKMCSAPRSPRSTPENGFKTEAALTTAGGSGKAQATTKLGSWPPPLWIPRIMRSY